MDAHEEVVVSLDGLPRPATVVAREGDQVRVRFRHAGGYDERWVPASAVLPVEAEGVQRPPVLKLVGLGLLLLVGLVLVWPRGSDKPLLDSTPSPSASVSPSTSPSASPSPRGVSAVLFGDALTAGKNDPPGTRTMLEVAARQLGWRYVVHAQRATGWTTSPSYAQRLSREVTGSPTVLVLQGGASDTDATPDRLAASASATLAALRKHFQTTRLVVVGPVAMEQPPDPGLVRVSRTLAAAARAAHVVYVDPIPWVTSANAEKYLSSQGFYPNPAGHAYLGARLAAVLKEVA